MIAQIIPKLCINISERSFPWEGNNQFPSICIAFLQAIKL